MSSCLFFPGHAGDNPEKPACLPEAALRPPSWRQRATHGFAADNDGFCAKFQDGIKMSFAAIRRFGLDKHSVPDDFASASDNLTW